jgi:hypothetical protein
MMPHSRIDFLIKFFWKIKRISNDNISKLSVGLKWPLEQIIEYFLVFSEQKINLIDYYYLIFSYSGDHLI